MLSMPMPIQSGPTLQHKKTRLAIALLLLFLLLSACSREELRLLNVSSKVHTLVDLPSKEETMTLSISFTLSSETKMVQVQVSSPSGERRWVMQVDGDEQGFYQLPPLALGKGLALEQGSYTMDVLYKDGRTLTEGVTVSAPRAVVGDAVSYDEETRLLSVRSPLASIEAYDAQGKSLTLEGESPVAIGEDVKLVLIGLAEEGLFYRLKP